VFRGGGVSVRHDSLLAFILEDHNFICILPFSFLDILKGMRISNREILAKNLNIINRFFEIVVDMLLHSENSLVLVSKFEFFRQLNHPQMLVLLSER
jgi:hypothetical protein